MRSIRRWLTACGSGARGNRVLPFNGCSPNYKPVSVPVAGRQSFIWAAHYWTALAAYPEVKRSGPLLLPYLALLHAGFAMPAALLPPRCALTAPFHPYRALRRGGIFSVALSVGAGLNLSPRPLAGALPCGDRTFLPPSQASDYPSGEHPSFSVALRVSLGSSRRWGRVRAV